MVQALIDLLGLDPALVSSEFFQYAALLIVIIMLFGFTKLVFIWLDDLFRRY